MGSLLVSSIITGALYTVTALGLVVVYKVTRVFNFAHGLISAFAAYVGYQAAVVWGWSFAGGLIIGMLTGAVIGLLSERLVLSRLYQRSPLELVIATFGISMVLEFLIIRIWGHDEYSIPAPFGRTGLEVFEAFTIPYYGLTIVVLSAIIVVTLTVILRRTDLGLRLRATFDDPVAARLVGISASRIRTLSWTVGGALAGAAGVLLTPILFLSPTSMIVILITAFAAAVIGGFNSFTGSLVGGVVVAATLNFGAEFISLRFRNLILYLLMVLLLWIRPHGLLGKPEAEHQPQEAERAGRWLKAWSDMLGMVAAQGAKLRVRLLRGHAPQWLLLVALAGTPIVAHLVLGWQWVLTLGIWLANTIAVAGLALLMFYGGQFSLAQGLFVGSGAYLTGYLMADRADSWLLVMIGVILIVGAFSFLIALPSARLSGAYFAAMTLALGLSMPEIAFRWTSVTGGASGMPVPTPQFMGTPMSDAAIFYLTVVCTLLVLGGLLALRNSSLGRRMVAARDSPDGAQTLGISPYLWQVVIIGLAGTLGALSGVLRAFQAGFVTPQGFGLNFALMLFVATVVSGSVAGAFWGAGIITFVPVIFRGQEELGIALFGVALLVALFLLPRDLSGADVLRKQGMKRPGVSDPQGPLTKVGSAKTASTAPPQT